MVIHDRNNIVTGVPIKNNAYIAGCTKNNIMVEAFAIADNLKQLPDLAEIRLIRKQLGWTQQGLARATGLSQSFINKIERNEADPGYRTAKKIFQTLYDGLVSKKKPAKDRTALDIMAANAEYVTTNQTVQEAKKLMLKNEFSQLPVIDNGIVKGSITDRLLLGVKHDSDSHKTKVGSIMESKFPTVDPDTKLETLRHLLNEYPAVLVDKGKREYGIVTKHDLLKAIK